MIENNPHIDGPIKLGKLELFAYMTDHTRFGWQANGQDLTQTMSQFSLIIPEYFPPEYEQVMQLPGIGPYLGRTDMQDNYLYHEVAKICQSQGKDIMVVDPAHDASFIALRYLPPATLSALTVLAAGLMVAKNIRLDRRNSFRFGLGTAAAGLVTASGLPGSEHARQLAHGLAHWELGPLEDILRESSSAQQLLQAGNSLPERTRGLMINTPPHWRGIKHFLQNDDLRTQTLDKFAPLKSVGIFDSLFVTRYYPQGKTPS